jgi:hypothetical protein
VRHLALLGDSTLDNRAYVAPHPDTAAHLRTALGADWSVELSARDGATMEDLRFQWIALASPPDAAVLSVGGNDALAHVDVLEDRRTSAHALLARLLELADDFGERYARALDELRPRVQRLLVCTVYEAPLADPVTARLARVPLALLDDRIVRAAARAGVDVIDLRAICTEDADFVRQIEPSPAGARKIALAIAAAVREPKAARASLLFGV